MSLFDRVVTRTKTANLANVIRERFAEDAPSYRGVVVSPRLIKVNGRLVNANIDDSVTPGSTVLVTNSGTPSAAIYGTGSGSIISSSATVSGTPSVPSGDHIHDINSLSGALNYSSLINRAHHIITEHYITGAQYSVIGLPATNTLGVMATANDGTGNANTILRSNGTGGLALNSLATPTISSASGGLAISPFNGTLQVNSILSVGAGSAGAPTLTFTGDTNTGIYQQAADSIGFSANGAEKVRVSGVAGLVIVGSTTETALGVDNVRIGTAGGTARIIMEDAGFATQWFFDASNGDFRLGNPGPTIRLQIASATGNITASGDTDTNNAFGRARIGNMATYPDEAMFGHYDRFSAGTYTLRANSNGDTFLNASDLRTISHRINNTQVMSMSGLGLAITGTLTTSGAAQLASLTVPGAATVSGNFNVANVLNVNTLGQRIGINMIADPQFDLDIAGHMRVGGFIVGRLARTLEDALFIAHFDGATPYATNNTGEPNGHRGQTTTLAGGAIFRPGKFAKSLQVAEATTNLIVNPSFGNALNNWSTWVGGMTSDATIGWFGLSSAKATHTGSDYRTIVTDTITVTTSTTYTISAWARGRIGGELLQIAAVTSGLTTISTTSFALTRDWKQYVLTFSTGGNTSIRVGVGGAFGNVNGAVLWVDAVQLEQKAFATPFCAGSLGVGHSWSGAAHASTSSRTAADAYFQSAGNIMPTIGTVMAWFWAGAGSSDPGGGARAILHSDPMTGGAYYLMKLSGAGVPECQWGSAVIVGSSSVTTRTWHHIAMTCDGVTVRLYLNGSEIGNGSTGTLPDTTDVAMRIGTSGGGQWLNGYVDDLAISAVPLDADEIRTIWESNAVVFAESSTFQFRATPSGLVWADEFGLWMRDSSGNSVLGVYGGSPATYSWGGLTIEPGDLVIGRSPNGYVHWDNSLATLGVKGSLLIQGGSRFEGLVDIATGGEIRQGTGTWGSSFTGLRLWNDGSVGRIGGYNNNTLQWYGDTAGNLAAGAGKIWLNSAGLNLRMGSNVNESYLQWLDASNNVLARMEAGRFTTSNINTLEMRVRHSSGGDPISELRFAATNTSFDDASASVFTLSRDGSGSYAILTANEVQVSAASVKIFSNIYLANQSSAPATPSGGGCLFAQAGALKWIGSSGTITTIAPA